MNQVRDFVDTHGRWVTIFSVVSILILGVTLIDNPSSGLSALIVLAAVALLSVIWIVKRSFFKAIAVFVCVMLEASFIIDSASFVLSRSSVPLYLSMLHVSTFLVLLTTSLLVTSRVGRWLPLFLSTFVGFVVVSLQLSLNVPSLVAYLSVVLFPLIIFCLMFYGNKKNSFDADSVPMFTMDQVRVQSCIERFLEKGYGATDSGSLTDAKSLVVWNDEVAFALHEIVLSSKLTIDVNGNLQHEGKPVDSWLSKLFDRTLPIKKFGSVPVMLVLIDKNNTNGRKSRVIGVSIPNSTGVIPVGVLPGKGISLTEPDRLFITLVNEFERFTKPLNKMQTRRLDMSLPRESTR